RMWRTINSGDSLEIRFKPDENGNVGDERTYQHGVETSMLYYYYDEKKRLTDIVRYNDRAHKLLPDVMFEYDDADHVIQKITISSFDLGKRKVNPLAITNSYLTLRIVFNQAGLKTMEALFINDSKKVHGRVRYSYTYNK